MADLPSNLNKMNDVEIGADAPVTEALFNKIGQNINGLIDSLVTNMVEFTASGTLDIPEGIQRVYIQGVGGGGGGGGGAASNGSGGGSGGAGGQAATSRFDAAMVDEFETLTITIGAAGTAGAGVLNSAGTSGGTGGTTTVVGNNFSYTYVGGAGGPGGALAPSTSVATAVASDRTRGIDRVAGGNGGNKFVPIAAQNGSDSFSGTGGTFGATSGGGSGNGGSGGGGGAGEGNGGAGGPGGSGAAGTAGSVGTGYGSGGGGGGRSATGFNTGAAGGAGKAGRVIIFY